MRRIDPASLLIAVPAVAVLAAVTACEPEEPERSIPEYTPEDVQIKPDQEDPNTCFGDKTDEEPDFDLALNLTERGEIREFHITVAEKKGLRVCGLRLRVAHRTRNPETGEWEPDGMAAIVVVPRIEPGEPLERVTRVTDGEFPGVTGIGPPESWTVSVERYNDVRKP
jgi:hypothetical protein